MTPVHYSLKKGIMKHLDEVRQILEMLTTELEQLGRRDRPFFSYKNAKSLLEEPHFTVGAKRSPQELVEAVETVLKHSVDNSHPMVMNQLFSGFDVHSFLGQVLNSLRNTTMATFEVAPVATMIEHLLIKKLGDLIGFDSPGGIMVTGGSQANYQALLCARQSRFPEMKERGVQGRQLTAFVSEQSHYSFEKAFLMLGLGTKYLIKVASGPDKKMDPNALEKAIQESQARGETPFFVASTAGTTVFGAFDPIKDVQVIADRYDLWHHVDGAWGAPVLFSKKYKHLMDGVSQADSVTWDAHKLMGIHLISSFIILKDSQILRQTNDISGAEYIFHEEGDASFNFGPSSVQCGRRADALGLWLAWLAKGDEGYAQMVENLMLLREQFVEQLRAEPRIQMIDEPGFLNVCYQVKSTNPEVSNSDLTLAIREQLIQSQTAMVNYSKLKETGNFFRMILANPQLKLTDLTSILDETLRLADQLEKRPKQAQGHQIL